MYLLTSMLQAGILNADTLPGYALLQLHNWHISWVDFLHYETWTLHIIAWPPDDVINAASSALGPNDRLPSTLDHQSGTGSASSISQRTKARHASQFVRMLHDRLYSSRSWLVWVYTVYCINHLCTAGINFLTYTKPCLNFIHLETVQVIPQ